MFIAVEGIDGSGKTTLSRGLARLLEEAGYSVFLTKEPTDAIENYVGDDIELFLRFTLDRYRHQREIERHLRNGEVVISDRYIRSSFAYQLEGAAITFGSSEEAWRWMESVSKVIVVLPEVNVLVKVGIDTAMKRIASRGHRTKFESEERLRKVMDAYSRFSWDIVADGTASPEAMVRSVFDFVIGLLKSK